MQISQSFIHLNNKDLSKSAIKTHKPYFMCNHVVFFSIFYSLDVTKIVFLDVYAPTGPKGYVSVISGLFFLLFLNSTRFARKKQVLNNI